MLSDALSGALLVRMFTCGHMRAVSRSCNTSIYRVQCTGWAPIDHGFKQPAACSFVCEQVRGRTAQFVGVAKSNPHRLGSRASVFEKKKDYHL